MDLNSVGPEEFLGEIGNLIRVLGFTTEDVNKGGVYEVGRVP